MRKAVFFPRTSSSPRPQNVPAHKPKHSDIYLSLRFVLTSPADLVSSSDLLCLVFFFVFGLQNQEHVERKSGVVSVILMCGRKVFQKAGDWWKEATMWYLIGGERV